MVHSRVSRFVAVAAVLAGCGQAMAWHGPGHDKAARAAIEALPPDARKVFATGVEIIANAALDPDTFTRPIAPDAIHRADSPEHYFDIEMLNGQRLPAQRYDMLKLIYGRDQRPDRVGMLPYAVQEWQQRLTVALAEHRRWPASDAVRVKAMVYAGLMSHYSADLCQPLHTTIHYDGWADGPHPAAKGVHLKVDALGGKIAESPAELPRGLKPTTMPDVFAGVVAEFDKSHALVERVYELAPQIPAYEATLKQDSEAARFARERMQAAARFTADLWLTAWEESAKTSLPDWHRRPPETPDKTATGQAAKE